MELKQNRTLIDYAIQNCPLSKFIDSLDNNGELSKVEIESELHSLERNQKTKVEEFFAILSKNYSFINTHCKDIEIYCCSYLNYWLDKKKDKNDKGVNYKGWQVIEKLWNQLKNKSPFPCERKYNVKSLTEKDKCIDFMVYCVNKEELKNKCRNPGDEKGFKDVFCKNFNDYTYKYYNKFNSESFCLDCATGYNDYIPAFPESCTLYDMPKTFPKYDTSTKTISEDTSKNSIINCLQPKVSFSISTLPWKYGLYGVSSLIGFSCLSIFLYKVKRINSQSINIIIL
ncbi:hypothetical protein PVBG_05453 [Plasmodium vivax Brazil I]|uniref:Uncharacterized protein n=1 Tax=Plasmodium vivax (strain Brazil I) TaxID=1033975 RepID=A0A0J9ST24_PLAV1|nr:hypothetical protein PVBG_05453 [Plasmodium vivax Brazil I]